MEFIGQQLACRNGNDRDEIWIAYKGVIYDVTHSKLWRKGKITSIGLVRI